MSILGVGPVTDGYDLDSNLQWENFDRLSGNARVELDKLGKKKRGGGGAKVVTGSLVEIILNYLY